ncbi:hypothetical protein E2C01_086128 [Portunus trituberculatus]|uniref:Uncharacterized protein n=1 Tax=Portunus trituberculatus TaxID=210409 RepID=A0A5B7J4M5_PORTR|nr:hypothetical protein [Portunus trituberculatus]
MSVSQHRSAAMADTALVAQLHTMHYSLSPSTPFVFLLTNHLCVCVCVCVCLWRLFSTFKHFYTCNQTDRMKGWKGCKSDKEYCVA